MTNENNAQLVAGVLNPADMDTSVRVQDDLYRYVNGTWLRTVKIPADRPSAGSFMELRDGAARLLRIALSALHQVRLAVRPIRSAHCMSLLWMRKQLMRPAWLR